MWFAVLLSVALWMWVPSTAQGSASIGTGSGTAAADTAYSPWIDEVEARRTYERFIQPKESLPANPATASAYPVTLEYAGSTLWTAINDVAVQGNFAYCLLPQGLAILDVTDPATPVRVAQLYMPPWGGRDIKVRGNFAYVARGYGGFVIVDITDPTAPILASVYDTPDYAKDVELSGNIAYVSDFFRLLLLDISDPYAPVQLAADGAIISRAYDAAVSGDFVYVAGGTLGVHVVDASDPTNPFIVMTLPLSEADLVDVSGHYLFAQNNGTATFSIWDISNPAVPVAAGTRDVWVAPLDMQIVDGFLFASEPERFEIGDVFNPPIWPAEDILWDSLVNGIGFAVVDTCIYIADALTGLKVLKQPDRTQMPQLVGNWNTPDFARSVSLSGDLAFVRTYTWLPTGTWSLHIVDISNPKSPVSLYEYEPPGTIYDAERLDSFLYVADNVTGLQVLDICNPASPTLLSEWSGILAYDLEAVDTLLYAANAQGLRIYDISSPSTPQLRDSVAGIGTAYLVKVSGDYAYLVTDSTGFQIVDLTDPLAPTPAGHVAVPNIKDIAVSGNFAYAVNVSGLLVFDISNPAAPFQVASHLTRGDTYAVEVRGAYAYVADCSVSYYDESGIWVYDITNPAQPSVAGFFQTPGLARDLAISGRDVFVADDNGFLCLSVNLGSGDVNDDGKLTGADLVWLVNYLYKEGPDPLPNLYEGDVNCDGEVNLLDLIYLGNHVFRAGLAPC